MALDRGMPESVLQWTGGWNKRIPETYLRTLGLKQAKSGRGGGSQGAGRRNFTGRSLRLIG